MGGCRACASPIVAATAADLDYGGFTPKLAVIESEAVASDTVHVVACPWHRPLQPVNWKPGFAVAVKVTVPPLLSVQEPPEHEAPGLDDFAETLPDCG
jgi:hypothetical protein